MFFMTKRSAAKVSKKTPHFEWGAIEAKGAPVNLALTNYSGSSLNTVR
jgi:hypothetical protein